MTSWENVALLVRAGHVDRGLVYESFYIQCQWWWAALAPLIRRLRIERAEPGIYEHVEWLAGLMAGMGRNAGLGTSYDEATVASTLDRGITRARDEIRLAEELRAVIVRPMASAAPPAPQPAAQEEAVPAGPPA